MSTEIKPETQEIANLYKKAIKIDPKTGLATAEDKDALTEIYLSTLPDVAGVKMTKDHVAALSKHNLVHVAGAGLALGEASIPLMKKHADLLETELVVPLTGGDKIEVGFSRVKMSGAPGAEKTEKYGHLSHGYTVRATRGGAGQLSAVKAHLFASAAEHLQGKK